MYIIVRKGETLTQGPKCLKLLERKTEGGTESGTGNPQWRDSPTFKSLRGLGATSSISENRERTTVWRPRPSVRRTLYRSRTQRPNSGWKVRTQSPLRKIDRPGCQTAERVAPPQLWNDSLGQVFLSPSLFWKRTPPFSNSGQTP